MVMANEEEENVIFPGQYKLQPFIIFECILIFGTNNSQAFWLYKFYSKLKNAKKNVKSDDYYSDEATFELNIARYCCTYQQGENFTGIMGF